MPETRDLVGFLDSYLKIAEVPDYAGAHNGLQVENSGATGLVAVAVDACEASIQDAAAAGAKLLIVHHGLFWQGVEALRGSFYRKIRTALMADMAIYSAHLPLDLHAECGNNSVLARKLDLHLESPFLEYKGWAIGLQGVCSIDRSALLDRIEAATGFRPHCAPGGPAYCQRIGLLTGAGGSQIKEAALAGVDTFITGEGPHWSYPLAEELGINLIYAGHYATETFGVQALGQVLQQHFGLPWQYMPHPSGL